jgi:D-alanyl-D-alanine endopeptidase (penicillin-binding protein 7)
MMAVASVGWALLHFLWKGALLSSGTALVLGMLRNARPQQRYAVACAALLVCLLVPAVDALSRKQAEGALLPVAAN